MHLENKVENIDEYPNFLEKCQNSKSEIAISQQLSMNFEFCIHESDRFVKDFQTVITITARTAKIGPRSSKKTSPDLLSRR